mmetsp:Transcript_57544/g.117150  ORF Transcript_57544/g.117150 Transcript_57544/m.117150 type:complete len:224 (+) Transcript_57544:1-672(+)
MGADCIATSAYSFSCRRHAVPHPTPLRPTSSQHPRQLLVRAIASIIGVLVHQSQKGLSINGLLHRASKAFTNEPVLLLPLFSITVKSHTACEGQHLLSIQFLISVFIKVLEDLLDQLFAARPRFFCRCRRSFVTFPLSCLGVHFQGLNSSLARHGVIAHGAHGTHPRTGAVNPVVASPFMPATQQGGVKEICQLRSADDGGLLASLDFGQVAGDRAFPPRLHL